jgi:Family of unknown function (DUF5681)
MELTKTNNGQWKPGQSGNPQGRPLGARQSFSAGFLRDLAEVWAEHGKATMLHSAKLKPEVFFATCARLIPKDVQLTVQQHHSFELDPVDLEILRAIKAAIPDAGDRQGACRR